MKNCRKLELNKIAEVFCVKYSNGFMSEALRDAILKAEECGLAMEPVNQWLLLTDDRELDFTASKLSREADLVLLLLAKAGDKEGMTKLYESKRQVISSLTRQYAKPYILSETSLEKDMSYYEQCASEAFLEHIYQTPILYTSQQDGQCLMYSHTNLQYSLVSAFRCQPKTSEYLDFKSSSYRAKVQIQKIVDQNEELAGISEVDFATFENYCLMNGVYKSSSQCRDAYTRAQLVYSNETTAAFSSKKQLEAGYFSEEDGAVLANVKDPNSIFEDEAIRRMDGFDNSGTAKLLEILNELRKDSKHGKDIEILLAHLFQQKNFDLSSINNQGGELAQIISNRQTTAALMGLRDTKEVKLSLKKACEYICRYVSKHHPELYSELVQDRNARSI